MEQRLRPVGKTGQGRVGAHRAHRLLAVDGHGQHDEAQVFVGVAEGSLAHDEGLMVGPVHARRRRQALYGNLFFAQPLRVRLTAIEALLDLQSCRGKEASEEGAYQMIIPGDIEYTDDLISQGMADRRGRTGEILPTITIMFCRHQLHDMSIGERCPNGVGTSRRLAPMPTRNKIDVCKATTNCYPAETSRNQTPWWPTIICCAS